MEGTIGGELAITGATGFLGRHLVGHLSRLPGVTLRALSRSPAAQESFPTLEILTGDLQDPAACRQLVRPGSVVVNLAYHAAGSRADNLRMAETLAAACREGGARGLLHCSTAVVAGRAPDDVITEATPCRPVSEYERTKLTIEALLRAELCGHCPVTIVRPTAVFGTGGSNLVRFADDLTRRGRLHGWAKATLLADRRLHLVCVENVVAAISFLLRRGLLDGKAGLDGEVFLVSDDEAPENNYRDITRILAEALGTDPLPISPLPGASALLRPLLRMSGRSDTNPRRIYSCRKLLELGFEKPLSLPEGVRRFGAAYAQGRHV